MSQERMSGRSSMEGERERALEILTKAFASDRISMDEYERRATEIQRAPDPAKIALVVSDLPQDRPAGSPPPRPAPEAPPAPQGEFHAFGGRLRFSGSPGAQSVACIMGDRRLQGDWLNGDRVEAFTMMGSTTIDLRDVALPPDRLRIEAFVLMGETRVIVPRGLAVRMNVFPFMGEAHAKREVNQRVQPGEPHVVIEGFVMMGSLVVVVQD